MEDTQREYSMSNADLMMFTSNLVQSITRDILSFSDYGIDAIAVSDFETLGNTFEVFPPDNYYQADVGIATETKEATREQLLLDTRKITNRALVKWGESSGRYKKFGVKGLMQMTDKTLLATARMVTTTATDYLTLLSSEGLTQIIIDDYAALAQQFEDDLNGVSSAVETRDIKTRERITLGNELYSYVAKYCTIGKTIWNKLDEAKYNDYIIYPTVHSGLSKPQNLTAVVDPTDPLKANIDFDIVENATEYHLFHNEVEVGFPSGEFEDYSTAYTNHFDAPLISGKRNYWKVRAYNADKISDYSVEVYIDA